MAVERISPSERQLNLTLALLRSKRGLTKREIFATVPGYGYTHQIGVAENKLFERDKAEIRMAGVVLEQHVIPGFEDVDYRYKVASRSFEWPKGFHPTKLQNRLLELAAHSWRDYQLTEELQLAMTRLVALGDTPDRQAIAELVPSFRPLDATFSPLATAIEDELVVNFSYRKPDSKKEEKRLVSPWRFLNVEGQWLIQGWDHTREDTRNFLLKRIVDKVIKPSKIKDLNYVPATEELLALADADLAAFRANNVATVQIQPDTAAWSHYEMDFEAGDTKELRFMDAELLAGELRRFGSAVKVISPVNLAEAIRAGLEKVAKKHA